MVYTNLGVYDLDKIRNEIDISLFETQSEIFIYEDSFNEFDESILLNINSLLDTDKFKLISLSGAVLKNRLLLILLSYCKAYELCDWKQLSGCGDFIIKLQGILRRLEGLINSNKLLFVNF